MITMFQRLWRTVRKEPEVFRGVTTNDEFQQPIAADTPMELNRLWKPYPVSYGGPGHTVCVMGYEPFTKYVTFKSVDRVCNLVGTLPRVKFEVMFYPIEPAVYYPTRS